MFILKIGCDIFFALRQVNLGVRITFFQCCSQSVWILVLASYMLQQVAASDFACCDYFVFNFFFLETIGEGMTGIWMIQWVGTRLSIMF
jgi:hypothetical protein